MNDLLGNEGSRIGQMKKPSKDVGSAKSSLSLLLQGTLDHKMYHKVCPSQIEESWILSLTLVTHGQGGHWEVRRNEHDFPGISERSSLHGPRTILWRRVTR